MKPAWDKLGAEYSKSATVVVADADCTAAAQALCQTHGVQVRRRRWRLLLLLPAVLLLLLLLLARPGQLQLQARAPFLLPAADPIAARCRCCSHAPAVLTIPRRRLAFRRATPRSSSSRRACRATTRARASTRG